MGPGLPGDPHTAWTIHCCTLCYWLTERDNEELPRVSSCCTHAFCSLWMRSSEQSLECHKEKCKAVNSFSTIFYFILFPIATKTPQQEFLLHARRTQWNHNQRISYSSLLQITQCLHREPLDSRSAAFSKGYGIKRRNKANDGSIPK